MKRKYWLPAGLFVVAAFIASIVFGASYVFQDELTAGEWAGRTLKWTDVLTNLNNWDTGDNAVTISSGTASFANGDSLPYLERGDLTQGRLYFLSFDLAVTGDSCGVYIGDQQTVLTTTHYDLSGADTILATTGTGKTFSFYADGDYLTFVGSDAGAFTLDNISLYEMNGRIGFVKSLAAADTITYFMAVDANADGQTDGMTRVTNYPMSKDDAANNYLFFMGDCKAVICSEDSIEVYYEFRD